MRLTQTGQNRLIATLAARGITWRDLSRAMGHRSHTHIQRVLRGESPCSPDLALRIADHLGMPVEAFFLTRISLSTRDFPIDERDRRPRKRAKESAA